MNYLKKIQKGKYALENDGTHEELIEVLCICFPDDSCSRRPNDDYQFYFSKTGIYWKMNDKTTLPTIKVTDFLDWHIDLCNENRQTKDILDESKKKSEPIKPYPLDPTLEQAREIYKESERESNPYMLALFEKFGDDLSKPTDYGWIYSELTSSSLKSDRHSKNTFPTKEQADAFPFYCEILREVHKINTGWFPDWSDSKYKGQIRLDRKEPSVVESSFQRSTLCFETYGLAQLFLNDHCELILKAKPLLS